ncbi:MAG: aspartate 1-decarboxylase [Candidatus Aminicenantia bacterium]
MMRKFLKAKIHNAYVTKTYLEYEGSISIDKEILEACGLFPLEHVEVYNINNGERFTTYVLEEEKGSKTICLNGAAARKASPGDRLIIVSFIYLKDEEIKDYTCQIVILEEGNIIKEKKALKLS